MKTSHFGNGTFAALISMIGAVQLLGCGGDPGLDTAEPRARASRLSADGASGPSVRGHVNRINASPPGSPFSGDLVHRSFHARDKDGVVEGNVVQHNASGFWFKGDIDCLHFLGPAEAVLSGPIRESSNPAIVGERVIFRVGDGGEGADDPPDRTSGLNVQPIASPLDCRTFVNPVFTPIESGNIQVVP